MPNKEQYTPKDITVEGSGTVFLLVPQTDKGRTWIKENIGPDNGYQPYYPDKVVVEHRYIEDILQGMAADGLAL